MIGGGWGQGPIIGSHHLIIVSHFHTLLGGGFAVVLCSLFLVSTGDSHFHASVINIISIPHLLQILIY